MQRLVTRSSVISMPEVFVQTGLLDGVPDDLASAILAHCHARQLQAGATLFLQDTEASHIYLIESGWIKLFRETLNGDEAVIDVLTAGHLVGNYSSRQSDSAAALTLVRLQAIPIATLTAQIEACPQLALNLLRIIQTDRHKQSMELEHERLQSAHQRLGCFLLRLCEPVHPGKPVTLHLPIDKSLIAARLGMKPETFSRALATLKKAVGLSVQGATLTVPNITLLADEVCGACSATAKCIDG